MSEVFVDTNEWFKINWLSLIFKITHYQQLRTKNSQDMNVNISYDNNHISNSASTKFLGLIIDKTLSRKNHIHQLMSKLSSVCCVMRQLNHVLTFDSLKHIYFAHFQSVIN